jgi:hypothetical protein
VANNWDKRRNDSAIRTLSLKELETYKALPPSGPSELQPWIRSWKSSRRRRCTQPVGRMLAGDAGVPRRRPQTAMLFGFLAYVRSWPDPESILVDRHVP